MHKRLYRAVEKLLDRIDNAAGDEAMLRGVLKLLVEDPVADSLGIESGRLYRERPRDYELIESIGGRGAAIAGKTVSRDYQIVKDIERRRLWIISPESPGFDPEVEAQFVDLDSAAILVGRDPAYILSLGIRHTGSEEDLLVLLETIRGAVGLKLREQALANQMRQARTIQRSLLPRRPAQLEGYDIAAVSLPAEEVGGDVYDIQEIEEGALGILLADASGHGLPAALQARDVVIGMRMGQAQGEKINVTVGRLNRVINRSGLASRFISLFYAELDAGGSMAYVNGGHCPPLLLAADDRVFELKVCGPVLGPLPEAGYRRGYLNMRPGELLLLYTDGVTERPDQLETTDEDVAHFGRDRLVEAALAHRDGSAQEIVQHILKRVKEFGRSSSLGDDVSVVVIKRLAAENYPPSEDLTRVTVGDRR